MEDFESALQDLKDELLKDKSDSVNTAFTRVTNLASGAKEEANIAAEVEMWKQASEFVREHLPVTLSKSKKISPKLQRHLDEQHISIIRSVSTVSAKFPRSLLFTDDNWALLNNLRFKKNQLKLLMDFSQTSMIDGIRTNMIEIRMELRNDLLKLLTGFAADGEKKIYSKEHSRTWLKDKTRSLVQTCKRHIHGLLRRVTSKSVEEKEANQCAVASETIDHISSELRKEFKVRVTDYSIDTKIVNSVADMFAGLGSAKRGTRPELAQYMFHHLAAATIGTSEDYSIREVCQRLGINRDGNSMSLLREKRVEMMESQDSDEVFKESTLWLARRISRKQRMDFVNIKVAAFEWLHRILSVDTFLPSILVSTPDGSGVEWHQRSKQIETKEEYLRQFKASDEFKRWQIENTYTSKTTGRTRIPDISLAIWIERCWCPCIVSNIKFRDCCDLKSRQVDYVVEAMRELMKLDREREELLPPSEQCDCEYHDTLKSTRGDSEKDRFFRGLEVSFAEVRAAVSHTTCGQYEWNDIEIPSTKSLPLKTEAEAARAEEVSKKLEAKKEATKVKIENKIEPGRIISNKSLAWKTPFVSPSMQCMLNTCAECSSSKKLLQIDCPRLLSEEQKITVKVFVKVEKLLARDKKANKKRKRSDTITTHVEEVSKSNPYNQVELTTEELTYKELFAKWKEMHRVNFTHIFSAKFEERARQIGLDTCDWGTVWLVMDFSANLKVHLQDQLNSHRGADIGQLVISAHYNHKLIAILNKDGEPTGEFRRIADVTVFHFWFDKSSGLDDNYQTVFACRRMVVDYLRKKGVEIDRQVSVSDGARHQFKSNLCAAHLAKEPRELNLKSSSWSHCPTSTGKGYIDALGHGAKKTVTEAWQTDKSLARDAKTVAAELREHENRARLIRGILTDHDKTLHRPLEHVHVYLSTLDELPDGSAVEPCTIDPETHAAYFDPDCFLVPSHYKVIKNLTAAYNFLAVRQEQPSADEPNIDWLYWRQFSCYSCAACQRFEGEKCEMLFEKGIEIPWIKSEVGWTKVPPAPGSKKSRTVAPPPIRADQDDALLRSSETPTPLVSPPLHPFCESQSIVVNKLDDPDDGDSYSEYNITTKPVPLMFPPKTLDEAKELFKTKVAIHFEESEEWKEGFYLGYINKVWVNKRRDKDNNPIVENASVTFHNTAGKNEYYFSIDNYGTEWVLLNEDEDPIEDADKV